MKPTKELLAEIEDCFLCVECEDMIGNWPGGFRKDNQDPICRECAEELAIGEETE